MAEEKKIQSAEVEPENEEFSLDEALREPLEEENLLQVMIEIRQKLGEIKRELGEIKQVLAAKPPGYGR